MNLVLLGAPGAGKGTQATKISNRYGIKHISTGDIFRMNIEEGPKIGKLAKSYIDRGELVPDEVTCEIVKERLARGDCPKGFLLDGFPRNLAQAEALGKFSQIDGVINIDIDYSLLMARICGRRVCRVCGGIHHVTLLGGAEKCPDCGGELYQRTDDNPETGESRLEVYKAQTAPLVDYYRKKGILLNFTSTEAPAEVLFGEIEAVLDRMAQR